MAKDQLVRQWEIVTLLNGSRRGLRSSELAKELDCSRATVDRALEGLRAAGIPLDKVCVGGETRHRLSMTPLPPLAPTPLQLSALRLAVTALSSLDGTKVVEEIRALLRNDNGVESPAHLRLRVPQGRADIVRTIESAIEHRHQVRLLYRGASKGGLEQRYEVSPLALRLVKEQLYLVGFCEGKDEPRVFKILRIDSAEYLRKPAERREGFDLEAWFRASVKTWGGPVTVVEVLLRPEVARLAAEYPIVENQTTEVEPNGAVRIRAEVAGLVEVKQWILGWGKSAVALSPPELVVAVREELRDALGSYPDPQPKSMTGLAKTKRNLAESTKLTG
jgi:predicted DNA-binding transcriptional regulator YafY